MEYYNEHRRELEKWCDTNFISYANELVELLLEKEIIEFIGANDGIKEGDEVVASFIATKKGTRVLRIKERK